MQHACFFNRQVLKLTCCTGKQKKHPVKRCFFIYLLGYQGSNLD